MPDRVLRDHSQPCEHPKSSPKERKRGHRWVAFGSKPVGTDGMTTYSEERWCPGGREVEFTEERVGPVSGEGNRYSYSKYGPPDVEKRRLISEWSDA